MVNIFLKVTLRSLPIIYMYWIWFQSSNFNPSKLEGIHDEIGVPIFLLLGAALEIGHLFEFAILYFLLIIAFLTFGKLNRAKEITAFTIAFLYGVLDEIHQFYVPFRSTSMFDLVKNTIGIIVIYYVIHNSYFKKPYSKLGSFLKGVPSSRKKNNPNIPL